MILYYYKFDRSKLYKEWVRISIDSSSEVEPKENKRVQVIKKKIELFYKGILGAHLLISIAILQLI